MSMPQGPAVPVDPHAPQKKNNTVLWVILILVVGGLCFGLVILAAILFPVFSQAKLAAQKTACLSNVKQLGLAHIIYTADNNDRFPLGPNWNQAVAKYVKNDAVWYCPIVAKEHGPGASGYAFNREMGGVEASKIPDPARSILLFESQVLEVGFVGGKADLADPPRHGQVGSFAMGDSSARFLRHDLVTTSSGDSPYLWKP